MAKTEEKKVNPNRFYWNPETKEKVFTEYTDGTKIDLNEGQKKKSKEASEACTRQAMNEIKSDINMSRKPMDKRRKMVHTPPETSEPSKVEPKK